jgi:hypothetical protein
MTTRTPELGVDAALGVDLAASVADPASSAADPAPSGATDRRPNESALQRRTCSLHPPSSERTAARRGGDVS